MTNIEIGLWADAPAASAERRFVRDGGGSPEAMSGLHVIAARADAARIDALLAAGAAQVLLGEAALHDATLVSEAAERHGSGRIGIWLPVRRASTQWGLDSTSNADFRVVAVSNPVPRWVALLEDGGSTDVDAVWWAGQMASAGCGTVLVSVPAPEDDDLLACAEMAEALGERFWLDTGSADPAELRFWVRYGQAARLVLPAGSDPQQVASTLGERLAQGGTACSG